MAFSAIRVVIPGKAAVSPAGSEISVPAYRLPAPGNPVRVLSSLPDPGHRVTRVRTVPVITHIKPDTISPTHHTNPYFGRSIAVRRADNGAICMTNCSERPGTAGIIAGPFQFVGDLLKTA
jgi:hypothetical protein